jgi:hypothetical protein
MKPPMLMRRSTTISALVAADEASDEALRRLKRDATYAIEIKQARNPANHRRFFALVGLVAERHPVYTTVPKALTAIKLAAGHVDYEVDPIGGGLVAIPKSISFAEIDNEQDFRTLFDAAVSGVLAHILPEFSREDIDAVFEEVARFGA